MTSLTLVKKVRKMGSALLIAGAFMTLVAFALGLFVPGHPWPSAGLGLAASLAMFAVSLFTTKRTALAKHPTVLWIALDYLAKVILVGAALVLAKTLAFFDVVVVAIIVAVAVVASVVAQAGVFALGPDSLEQT